MEPQKPFGSRAISGWQGADSRVRPKHGKPPREGVEQSRLLKQLVFREIQINFKRVSGGKDRDLVRVPVPWQPVQSVQELHGPNRPSIESAESEWLVKGKRRAYLDRVLFYKWRWHKPTPNRAFRHWKAEAWRRYGNDFDGRFHMTHYSLTRNSRNSSRRPQPLKWCKCVLLPQVSNFKV